MKYLICFSLILFCFSPLAAKKKRNKKSRQEAQVKKPKPDPFAKSDRITRFENIVFVRPDGSLLVRENIAIYNGDGDNENTSPGYIAAGGGNNEIKRGIIRSFPTKYLNKYKLFQNTTFKLLDVSMNGAKVSWSLDNDFGSNGYHLKIRDAFSTLEKGYYTYTIVYETEHQLKFLDKFDELVWNVTGNGWNFRIDSATCMVIIPGNNESLSNACYTGKQGDTASQCGFVRQQDTLKFYTSRALHPYEGLTIATSWKKGVLTSPGAWSQVIWMYRNNIGSLTMFLLLFLIIIYNLFKWWKYGRDLRPGTIIAQYEPPPGLSPAAAGFIYVQQMDNRLLAATITDLALRNLFGIGIEKKGLIFKDNEYSFKNSGAPFVKPDYEDYESYGNDLIGTVVRKGHYNKSLGSLNNKIASDLQEKYMQDKTKAKGRYFSLNDRYLNFGYLLSIFPFFILIFVVAFDAKVNPWAFIPLTGGFILCLITQYIFSKLFPAYNTEGRKVMDYIEGYRRYLKAVDENRLNIMNPPERTIDLYEKNLAFAIALDCEVEWGKKFESIIETAIRDGSAHAGFYSNSHLLSDRSFSGNSFVSGFSSTISSASSPPSSGSGGGSSFGGGSSGSGGGGGGGGGW